MHRVLSGISCFQAVFYVTAGITTDLSLQLDLKTLSAYNSGSFKNIKILAKDVQRICVQIQKCHSFTSKKLSANEILSSANKENCIKLLNSYKSDGFSNSASKKRAAVLVPFCQCDGHLGLLYTVRARHLRINGGEIAFPGGMFEKHDRSPEKTALRETFEEIGIPPNKVDIWGKGPEIDRPDLKITPVLGYLGRLHIKDLKINPPEVSEVFAATLGALISPEDFGVTRFRANKNFIFQTPVYLKRTRKIWGLTAYITHIILSCLVPEMYKNNIQFHPTVQKVFYDSKRRMYERTSIKYNA